MFNRKFSVELETQLSALRGTLPARLAPTDYKTVRAVRRLVTSDKKVLAEKVQVETEKISDPG